jgi:hypothetical protein
VPYFGAFLPNAFDMKSIQNYLQKLLCCGTENDPWWLKLTVDLSY